MSDSPAAAPFDAALERSCAAVGLAVQAPQRAVMRDHYRLVVDANTRFNLTRITDAAEAAVKHYADSLTLLAAPWFNPPAALAVLDVGTGAGFPAVPLAIVRPQWRITAIDGTGKKARFVAEAARELGLVNVEARHARASDLAGDCPAAFDVVVLRAVVKIAPGLKEVHRLVRPGGSVVFYKTGQIAPDELDAGEAIARALGLAEYGSFSVALPAPDGPAVRRLIRYRVP